MKFLLLIGGSREAWARLSPSEWSDSRAAHGALIGSLRQTGEFLECNELSVEPPGARVVRVAGGAVSASDGPLGECGNFASGYYMIDCVDMGRACAIASQLYEARFAPIEVRRVGAEG